MVVKAKVSDNPLNVQIGEASSYAEHLVDCLDWQADSIATIVSEAFIEQLKSRLELRLQDENHPTLLLYLSGNLGSGKTTLAQALFARLDNQSAFCSPSFSMLNEYVCSCGVCGHFDLYRLQHTPSLASKQIQNQIKEQLTEENYAISVVEWPEFLIAAPMPDWHIVITDDSDTEIRSCKCRCYL